MEDHPRVRKKPADVKVHIRRMNNNIILSGSPGEQKENAGKICEEKRTVISCYRGTEHRQTISQLREKRRNIYVTQGADP